MNYLFLRRAKSQNGDINESDPDALLTPLVEYGAAHGALAMTTPGDTTMVTVKEVEKIMGGGARVDR